MLDATQILQSHGLFEANQAAANYPTPSSGVTTVLLPSESFARNRIAGMPESIYSSQSNGHLPQLPNSAVS